MTGLAAGTNAEQGTGWDAERDVELLLAFLNTRDAEQGTDVLDAEATWRTWVIERALGLPGDPEQVRRVRDALRGAAGEPGSVPGQVGGTVRVEVHGGVPVLTTSDALGAVLAASARLAVVGYWERLKVCPAEDCRWVFFDRSRNRSRTWCSMRVCGNREKARNWRERARNGPLVGR